MVSSDLDPFSDECLADPTAHFERMTGRPSVQQLLAFEAQTLRELAAAWYRLIQPCLAVQRQVA
jgi:hypothetical protein